jgi:hypothetical protein
MGARTPPSAATVRNHPAAAALAFLSDPAVASLVSAVDDAQVRAAYASLLGQLARARDAWSESAT